MIKAFWWWLKSTWWQASYWLRPYDMLADRCRWRWQAAQQCHAPLLAQCHCTEPAPWEIADLNGWRRWCGRCGGVRTA